MADYYPLLAKAVSGLKTSTPEARRAIYDRARKALLGQLRSMQPPAPESAIEREAQALDDAVARLELELDFLQSPAVAETLAAAPPPAATALAEKKSEPAAPPPFVPATETKKPETAEDDRRGPQRESERETAREAQRETQRPAAPKPEAQDSGGLRRLGLMLGAVALVVAFVGFAAWKLRDRPEDLAKLTPAPESSDQATGGKIGERVGEAGQARNAPAGAPAAVGYRAAVLLQAPSEPGGVKTFVGSVVWRKDSSNRGPNQQLASAIRADVDVPEAHFKLSMVMEKNFESALSVSHTFTVRFEPGANSLIGDVKAINMPEMRRDEAPKGTPLLGLPVDIAPNVFLVGLASASEQQNIEAIRTQNWFDLPMSLVNGRIAKVTFEKGAAGEQIFADVMAEWKAQ
jgi:hypothetical protein